MSSRIIKNAVFLNKLRKAANNKKLLTKLIKGATPRQWNAISEVGKNVLLGQIEVTPVIKKKLCFFKHDLRKLSSRKVSNRSKERIIVKQKGSGRRQKGGFLIGTLLATIAPLLAQAAINKFSKK
jgi:hypothetical protein